MIILVTCIFFCKQKTAYELRISDWSSDVCSSDLVSNALYNHEAETEKYQYREKEVEALREAESNSEVLLNNGFGTYLDLLTARQNALNAELDRKRDV